MQLGFTRKLVGLASALALGAGLMVSTAAPASAAGCSGTHLDNWPITGGYISVWYNSSTGKNCAMTYTNKPGKKQYIRVDISTMTGKPVTDAGNYTTYAGPVSVYAKGQCIEISGQVTAGGPRESFAPLYCG
ncbi:spore-associated protein A [Streptosporangium sp. NBC_01639]|uniref:spore-associated protein A n=1 Tax=Streptosporangium sp. NBC_01639 TaxID=2975948 RepID=UPI003864BDEC|nr:spore-associated protein A [Streptosporangium sp. NBC_01639]